MTHDWKMKDRVTGLNHQVRTKIGPSSAVTFCDKRLTIDWSEMVEMPPCAVITCLGCVAFELRYACR